MELITLYGKTQKGVAGTTYYTDERRTKFKCRDPWHKHRTSKVITLNGWRYWLEIHK